LNRLVPIEVHYMEKNPGMFSSKTFISFRLNDMGVSKLSANVFFLKKVNYSFNVPVPFYCQVLLLFVCPHRGSVLWL